MERLIDREKVIDQCEWAIRQPSPTIIESKMFYKEVLALLKEQEAVEPKTGQWIYKKYDDMFMCSSCEKYSIRNDYPYCHWCGAKMEGRSVKLE